MDKPELYTYTSFLSSSFRSYASNYAVIFLCAFLCLLMPNFYSSPSKVKVRKHAEGLKVFVARARAA